MLRKLSFAAVISGLLFSVGGATVRLQASGTNKHKPSVLGKGRGIDHVIVAVRDLEAAKDVYRDTLGFTVPPRGEVFVLPSGLALSEASFEGNYLEWRAIHDRDKATRLRPQYVNFLEKHEGALILVLNVSSARSTADFLRARSFNIWGPEPAPFMAEETASPAFWSLGFNEAVLPCDLVFAEYAPSLEERFRRANPEEWQRHANTARAIKSVWIAVRELKTATKAYEAVGLLAGKKRNLPALGAIGREIQAGQGIILLLQPQGKDGQVAAFLAARGEGIMGISIEVSNLDAARALLEKNTARRFTPYAGPYGKSILIPAEFAHGVSIEMFQP